MYSVFLLNIIQQTLINLKPTFPPANNDFISERWLSLEWILQNEERYAQKQTLYGL